MKKYSLDTDNLILTTADKKEHPLHEINKEKLRLIRKGLNSQKKHSDKGYFILKIENKLFYTEIPTTANFVGENLMNCKHKCAETNNCCKRFSALPDEKGGCQKVRLDKYPIEEMDFITIGYQTIGTTNNALFVKECSNYC